MVYIAYFTELNLQICDYSQKRRICCEIGKYAFDKNFHGHCCPRRKAAKFCHPGTLAHQSTVCGMWIGVWSFINNTRHMTSLPMIGEWIYYVEDCKHFLGRKVISGSQSWIIDGTAYTRVVIFFIPHSPKKAEYHCRWVSDITLDCLVLCNTMWSLVFKTYRT